MMHSVLHPPNNQEPEIRNRVPLLPLIFGL